MYPDSRTGDLFYSGIWNLGLWNPEYSSKNTEFHLRLDPGIQVPLTKTGIQNPSLTWIPLTKGEYVPVVLRRKDSWQGKCLDNAMNNNLNKS